MERKTNKKEVDNVPAEEPTPTKQEDTKQTPSQKAPQIRWRKIGGGTFQLPNGKIIKPNQVFTASVDEIPMAFRDVIVPADKDTRQKLNEEAAGNAALPVSKMPLFVIMAKSPGWFDVVNSTTGKQINEKSLREKEANNLVAELNA